MKDEYDDDETFEDLLESLVGRTITHAETDEDDEVFLVLDDESAIGIGYDEDDGMYIRSFIREVMRDN